MIKGGVDLPLSTAHMNLVLGNKKNETKQLEYRVWMWVAAARRENETYKKRTNKWVRVLAPIKKFNYFYKPFILKISNTNFELLFGFRGRKKKRGGF
jgi:hypothetical protein